MTEKVSLKFILASEPNQPFKTVSVPNNIPVSACVKKVAEAWGMKAGTCGVISSKGIGINQQMTAGALFITHGGEIKIIPRD